MVFRLYRIEWPPEQPGDQWSDWAETRRDADAIAAAHAGATVDWITPGRTGRYLFDLLRSEAARRPPQGSRSDREDHPASGSARQT